MSTMTENNPDAYNGCANRETWAFNLHWQNDQGLYSTTLEEARRYIEETYGQADHLIHDADERTAAYCGAAEHVIAFWSDWLHDYTDHTGEPTMPRELAAFRDEVGSWWRIDVREVADTLRESLDNES